MRRPLSAVEHALDLADMLLIMSVNPGFGGQKYIPYVTEKIRHAREIIDRRQVRCVIEVDGGIDIPNMPEVIAAGSPGSGGRIRHIRRSGSCP